MRIYFQIKNKDDIIHESEAQYTSQTIEKRKSI